MVRRIIILIIILTQSSVFSQNPTVSPPRFYVAEYKETVPIMDGSLDEGFWESVSWSDTFIDIEGPGLPRPDYDTRIKIAYTDDALYIGARLMEPHIWATLMEKNKPIFRYDNNFEVFIDPNGDHCNYYELELNALNTIWELSLPYPYRNRGKPRNPDNMKNMESKVKIYGSLNDPSDIDSCWTVEVMFPFFGFRKYDALHIPPRKGEYWRLNFSRVQWDSEIQDGNYMKSTNAPDNWVWSPQYEVNMHAPEHWGYLFFDHMVSEVRYKEDWNIANTLVNTIMDPSISSSDPFKTHPEKTENSSLLYSKMAPPFNKNIQYYMNRKTCFWKSIIED